MKTTTNLCRPWITIALSAALGMVTAAQAADTPVKIPAAIAAAVASDVRPDADRQRDARRKPAETLAFAGIKPGDQVGELLPGGGYFTRLISQVVGPNGHVYALAPPPLPSAPPDMPDFSARVRAIAADPHFANLSVVLQPLSNVTFPAKLDLVWTSQNYHDFHNAAGVQIAVLNSQVFEALKPGGVYFVLDHAAPGAGGSVTSTLHRIDPETVKKEVTAAGFVLEASSDLLRSAEDPHTVAVFDPSIRGNTDQFILKFRKPTTAK
jgi:predicted methyltransferase